MSLSELSAGSCGAALALEGVSRRFGGFHAVSDLDLAVGAGERRAILGPNGAGKTTLFNLVTGDLPVSAGHIRLDGTDVTTLATPARIARGLRRTYQLALLFDGLSVEENLYLAVQGSRGASAGMMPLRARDLRRQRARELAARVDLAALLPQPAGTLSHGQRRQLEIGMALAGDPRILLFDEPAAGLSPAERELLAALILDLPRTITLVMIEHDMDIALTLADVVSVLDKGRLIAEGTPEEIVNDARLHEIYLGKGHA